jgi:hypothetical protein
MFDTMEQKSSNPSLKKVLIAYSEFSRLKSIEVEFNNLQKEKEKSFDNSKGKLINKSVKDRKLQIINYSTYTLISGSPSTSQQIGEGAENKKQKLDLDSDSNDFYNNLAEKVAEKITAKSSFTNLWRPSEISTPTVLAIKTPSTLPPLPYAIPIEKNLENDKFGKNFKNFDIF